jgi:hypothetical protein
VAVLGYRAETLASLPLPTTATLAMDELRAPLTCEARLPAADWMDSVHGSHADPSSSPGLTADWLSESCPGLERVHALVECTGCAPTGSVNGCQASIDLTLCGGSQVQLHFDRSGGACLMAGDGCTIAVPTQTQAVSRSLLTQLSCALPTNPNCSIDVDHHYGPAPIRVRTTVLPGLTPFLPTLSTMSVAPDPSFSALLGALWDMAVVTTTAGPARLVVSGVSPGLHGYHCTQGYDGRLWVLDAESLALIRTATSPQCVTTMIADPKRPGTFIGVFGANSAASPINVGRFDLKGRLIQTATLAAPALVSDPQQTYTAERLVMMPDGRRIAFLYLVQTAGSDPGPSDDYLDLVNSDRLALAAPPIPIMNHEVLGFVPFDSGFAISVVDQHSVDILSPDASLRPLMVGLPTNAPRFATLFLSAGSALAASVTSVGYKALVEFDSAGMTDAIRTPDLSEVTAGVIWPKQPSLLLLALAHGSPDGYSLSLSCFPTRAVEC